MAYDGAIASDLLVYVGCYTTPDRDGHGQGIAAFSMDGASGRWRPLGVVAAVPNPSFLALHPNGRVLYCVHGAGYSEVSAFAIADRQTGRLAALGTQPSGGSNPVHLEVHRDGNWLVVANYLGASVAVLPVGADGALGPPRQVVPLAGEPGPDPVEQSGPHPHHIPFDPSGRFVAVPDKGLDRVFVFRLDSSSGTLSPAEPGWTASAPGAGPRHIAFHPFRPLAYVVNELDSTITTYTFESATGRLRPVQVVSSRPPCVTTRSTGAEIVVHPRGHTLYVSNRGHDCVGVFSIGDPDGHLTPTDWQSAHGRVPRAMALDPDGRFLYVANQASDSIVAFGVDPASGALEPMPGLVETGSPSSIVFLRLAETGTEPA